MQSHRTKSELRCRMGPIPRTCPLQLPFTPQLVDDSYTRVSVEIGCADLRSYTAASSEDRGTWSIQTVLRF
jgi:hypothetical protein